MLGESIEKITIEQLKSAQLVVALLTAVLMNDQDQYAELMEDMLSDPGNVECLISFALAGMVTSTEFTGLTLEETIQRIGQNVATIEAAKKEHD